MSLTQQDREWFDRRDTLTVSQKAAVDNAFEAATEAIRASALPASNSDAAASLEAALVRYVIESDQQFEEAQSRYRDATTSRFKDVLTPIRHDVDKA